MLQNAYFLAQIGADTAENQQHFAENWQLPYGSSCGRAEARRARVGRGAPREVRGRKEEVREECNFEVAAVFT